MKTAQAPVRASTQAHLDIEEIKDDLVVLKDGSCCLVAQTTAVNFDLLSEKEQESTIFAYASLLNSLSFSIQILVRSQQKDVSGYLNLLAEQERKVIGEKLRKQIRHYRDFVEKTVREKEVLDKKFYIIIPFSVLEMGPGSVISQARKKGLPYPLETILERAKTNLYPKRDHLIRQFSRLGLELRQIKTSELIKLFYDIYNQEATGFEEFVSSVEYQTPVLTPAFNNADVPRQPKEGLAKQAEKIKERRVFMDTQQTNDKPLGQAGGEQTTPTPTAPSPTPTGSVPGSAPSVPQEAPAPKPVAEEPAPSTTPPAEPSPTPTPGAPAEEKPAGDAGEAEGTDEKAQDAINSALKGVKPQDIKEKPTTT